MSFPSSSSSSPELLSPPEEPSAPPRKRRSRKPQPATEGALPEAQDGLAASVATAPRKPPTTARKRRPKKPASTEADAAIPEPPSPAPDEVGVPVPSLDPDHPSGLPTFPDEHGAPSQPADFLDPNPVLRLPPLFVGPEPAPATPGELSTEVLAQKRRYKNSRSAETDLADDPDGEISALSSLLQNLLERKQNGRDSAPEGETRNKINRFTSRATAGTPATEFIAPVPETSLLTLPGASTHPSPPENHAAEALAAVAFPKFEPRTYEPEPSGQAWMGSTPARRLCYFGVAAALVLAAFLAGRSHARPNEVPVPRKVAEDLSPVRWMPVFANQLDRALAADRAGDLTTAASLTDELAKSMKPNPFLQAYRASIDTRRGRSTEVEAALSRLLRLTPGLEASAPLNEAQGFNYARRRDFDLATESFQTVAETEPLNTTNLLHLGEAQRRNGRLAEAAATFQLALDRLPDSASPATADRREYLAYEKRLSEVENGLGDQWKTVLEQHFNAPAPSHYWLLTSAAVALQKGEMAKAIPALKKAQASLTPEQFSTLMDDYFFRSFAYHPEMKGFLGTPTSGQQQARLAKMEFYIDP